METQQESEGVVVAAGETIITPQPIRPLLLTEFQCFLHELPPTALKLQPSCSVYLWRAPVWMPGLHQSPALPVHHCQTLKIIVRDQGADILRGHSEVFIKTGVLRHPAIDSNSLTGVPGIQTELFRRVRLTAALSLVAAVALALELGFKASLLSFVELPGDRQLTALRGDGVAGRVQMQTAAVRVTQRLAAELCCRGDVEEVLIQGTPQIRVQVGRAYTKTGRASPSPDDARRIPSLTRFRTNCRPESEERSTVAM
ncbi:hypothetical protein EYF80_005856 [Liparis tanakae]|uniref:Uncharacterized protein n=1 Tax=Liparis tanakae TaxID=230148 RepID=A0A4Z2J0X9_9TELE|nr:hypothetical protein EYF80_005856 [Liparis tanakae]